MNPKPKITHGWRRGLVDQLPRREHERLVRWHAVSLCRWAIHHGFLAQEAAQCLGISARTLRHWRKRWRCPADRLEARRCGRPAAHCSAEVRTQVLSLLKQTGPHVGLPALRSSFGGVSRAELARILGRYRRVCRVRYHYDGRRLTWHRAGAVWALDFVVPPGLVDGRFECVLAVRDLGSQYQLFWQAMTGQTAAVVVYALQALFVEHGAPLVLKSDNGSAFIAKLTAELLVEWEVVALFSPPLRPQYNGGCERANGTLRTYTDYEAVCAGHPGDWAARDLAQALARINHLDRPRGLPSPARTPAEAWEQRTPLTDEERRAFRKTVAIKRCIERAKREVPEGETLNRQDQAAIDRVAASEALQAHGLLTISPPGGRWPAPPPACALTPADSSDSALDTTRADPGPLVVDSPAWHNEILPTDMRAEETLVPEAGAPPTETDARDGAATADAGAPFDLAPSTTASPRAPSSPHYEQEFPLACSHGALPAGKIDVPARQLASPADDACVPRSAHVGQGLFPSLWRLITLPIDLLKTANNP